MDPRPRDAVGPHVQGARGGGEGASGHGGGGGAEGASGHGGGGYINKVLQHLLHSASDIISRKCSMGSPTG
jgi:hypothetical protein